MSEKILLINLPGMGDTLMFTPVLAPLKARFASGQVSALVMHESSRQVLENNPYIDRLLFWDFLHEPFFKSMGFIRGLRQERFTASLTSFPGNRAAYNVAAFLIGARKRIAHQYRHRNARNLHWLNHQTLPESDRLPNIEENIRLLEGLGIDISTIARDPQIFLSASDEQFALDFWQRHRLAEKELVVGMHTWSTEYKNMHRKCWPADKFAALIDHITAQYRSAVLLFEGPHDAKNSMAIAAQTRQPPIQVQGTSVKQTAALLKKCRVLVTNDSGVMHLAAAVQTPCVAIFGPTDQRKLAPFSTRHAVVCRELPCRPCFYYSARPLSCRAGIDYECLRSIPVPEVFAAMEKLIRMDRP